MLVTHRREKLIQAMIYFASHTQACGKVKLFKLLYLLDFTHFRSTGLSVTGLEYHAWRMGPVPVRLADEWENLESDMAEAIQIRPEQVYNYRRETVVARTHFDDAYFTKRELRLMGELATQYRDTLSASMIDVTHAENGAWARVWEGGEGFNKPIDYELSLEEGPERERVLGFAREQKQIEQQLGTR